jgi:hypothetical protein
MGQSGKNKEREGFRLKMERIYRSVQSWVEGMVKQGWTWHEMCFGTGHRFTGSSKIHRSSI